MAVLGEVCTCIAKVLFCLHARPNTVPPLRNVNMVRVCDMQGDKKHKVASSQQCAPPMEKKAIFDFSRKLQNTRVPLKYRNTIPIYIANSNT